MSKATRKKFTEEEKSKAVADYLSGSKSAKEIAQELGTDVHNIYHWRAAQDEKKRNERLYGLQSEGVSADMAEILLRKEEEIAAYQKKVAEQAVIIDLLKKLQTSHSFPPESELSGLIATSRKSDRKRKRAR
jgi:transposase-like protein